MDLLVIFEEITLTYYSVMKKIGELKLNEPLDKLNNGKAIEKGNKLI